MSFILLNDTGGSILIDSVLPAVYSSILILGATLYTISLFALLVPLLFVIGCVGYIVFVYQPVLAAHSHRTAALRQINQEAIILSKVKHRRQYASITQMKRSMSSLKKIFIVLKHAVQSMIINFSDRRVRIYAATRVAREKEWCRMNSPLSSQGKVSTTSRMTTFPDKRVVKNAYAHVCTRMNMRVKTEKNKYTVPTQIAQMMTAVTKGKRIYQSHEIVFDDPFSSDTSRTQDELVVIVSKSTVKSSRKLKSSVLFDTRDALVHMRSRLISDLWDPTNHFDVSESDLSAAFQNILEVFYPDGISLSFQEKAEAFEYFNEWKETLNQHFKLESNQQIYYQERMISFHLFEKWFTEDLMHVVNETMSERLLSHAFKCPPSPNSDKSKKFTQDSHGAAPTINYHTEGIKGLKNLKIVSPHTLLTPIRREPFSDRNTLLHDENLNTPTASETSSPLSPRRQ